MQICPTSCPTYDGRRAGRGEPIGRCAICKSLIYQGDRYFFNEESAVCGDCAEHIDTDELRLVCGFSGYRELFLALGFESE